MRTTTHRKPPRGDRRREILDATLRIVRDGGVAAVTHRAVAAEAGVPLAATTYYFASKDDLLDQALNLVAERSTAELAERAAGVAERSTPRDVADALVALSVEQLESATSPLVAQYELYLEAARRPSLRGAVVRWDAAYAGLVAALLQGAGVPDPAAAATIVVSTLEGLLIGQLANPRPTFTGDVLEPAVRRLVGSLASPGAQAALS